MAAGATSLAVGETWQIIEHHGWLVWLFWLLILVMLSPPRIVISTDGLPLTYSKLKLHSRDAAADPRLRIALAGSLVHAKVIERRPREQKAADR